MTLKGWADQQKHSEVAPQYATINPVRAQQYALDVISHAAVYEVGTDAAEADSTDRTIVATGHSARKGDVIRFTSGSLADYEFTVTATDTDSITVSEKMPTAPSPGDAFAISRHRYLQVQSDGSLPISFTVDLGPGPATPNTMRVTIASDQAQPTLFPITSLIVDHGTTPITTGAWLELVSSLSANVNYITTFSSSGQTLELGLGGSGSEARVAYIPPGGFDAGLTIRLPIGERVSARAVGADADQGELQMNFLGEA